ncbi:MAG: hypothetical protein ACPGNV_17310 [Mangrovicoccus sp.]
MKHIALASLFTLLIGGAQAGEISLSKPLSSANLQDRGVVLNVFWQETALGNEVTATYVSETDATPKRFKMLLNSGDEVQFGLPGLRGISYTFNGTEDAITVKSRHTTAAAVNG